MQAWATPNPIRFRGLPMQEAERLLREHGLNELEQKKGRKGWQIFFGQFLSPLVAVLIVASGISFFLGDRIDTGIILVIVVINALLGFFQEYKAEKTVRGLRALIAPRCVVLRGNKEMRLESKYLVPGDVVHLKIGDLVPADLRLLKVDGLTVNEAPLTGESLPVEKTSDVLPERFHLPQQLTNMAFMGTTVSAGEGWGRVVTTGKDTFFGKISTYLKEPESPSDFEKSVGDFSGFLLKVILGMSVFVFGVNAVLSHGVLDSLLFALALAVGMTPEQLPIIITISLSQGAEKLARAKVVVKKLTSIEDLGNMDILCTDKTGTLTEGELRLQSFLDVHGKEEPLLLSYALLCSDQDNLIDRALWKSKNQAGAWRALKSYKILDKNEFDFERRRMSVLVKTPEGKTLLIVKGGVESLEDVSTVPSALKVAIEQHRASGLSTIAVAVKELKKSTSTKDDERGLKILGFLTFLDPPREDAGASLRDLAALGVRIKVLSGDDPLVTRAVCKEVGFSITGGKIYTGEQLDRMSHQRFVEVVHRYDVFSRIAPEHKYKIVKALNTGGKVTVAFMGDGINDAPAIQAADVGISVNTATDIAKEAADIILLEKNLQVIVQGVRDGRRIFANIRKYILNTVSANYGNMFTVALSSLFLKFVPLLPSQILLNNLVTDTPMLAISTDHVDAETLKRPSKLDTKMIRSFMMHFGLLSSFFDLLLIVSLLFVFKASPELFRTGWFLESALSEMLVTFSLRTERAFWKSRPGNVLFGLSMGVVGLLFAVIYIPFVAQWFQFVPLSPVLLAWCLFVVAIYVVACEVFKRWFFKKRI